MKTRALVAGFLLLFAGAIFAETSAKTPPVPPSTARIQQTKPARLTRSQRIAGLYRQIGALKKSLAKSRDENEKARLVKEIRKCERDIRLLRDFRRHHRADPPRQERPNAR